MWFSFDTYDCGSDVQRNGSHLMVTSSQLAHYKTLPYERANKKASTLNFKVP